MARRIAVILSILGLLNVYAAWRIIVRWPWADAHPGVAWAAAGAFFLLQLLGPFGDHLWFPPLKRKLPSLVRLLDWTSYLAFGVMSLAVVYAMAADVVGITWQLIALPGDPLAFDRWTLLLLGGAIVGATIVGVWQAKAGPQVRTVEVPIARLPAAFDGFKIAQISDLHLGPTIGAAYARKVVDLVNSLTPDVIALTGDFADAYAADVSVELAPLADLRSTHGSFFVTGNHEYFWDGAAWMAAMRRLGARVLVNEHVILSRNGGALVLGGVTDYSTRHMGSPHASDPRQAMAGAPPELAKILLAHQPASYAAAEAAGINLQLSGHTHSGQYFPFNLLIRFFQRYYKGLNRHGAMWIYVNRGTGYWGPPLRAGVPAEVTLLVLRPASG